MKAVVFDSPGKARVTEIPDPVTGLEDVDVSGNMFYGNGLAASFYYRSGIRVVNYCYKHFTPMEFNNLEACYALLNMLNLMRIGLSLPAFSDLTEKPVKLKSKMLRPVSISSVLC